MIDENTFFREATLRICGSLEIEKVLWETLVYFNRYMPADMIFLLIYDPNTGIGENIARADLNGGQLTSVKIGVSEAVRNQIADLRKNADRDMDILIADDAKDNPILGAMDRVVGNSQARFIGIAPVPKWDLFACIIIGNNAGEKYTQDHVRLLSLINEPIAIALSNYMRFREVSRLKDILVDDNRYLQNELLPNRYEEIVGAQFGLRHVMEMVVQVARQTSPVLLLGETGAGKEVIATAIHNQSPRREGPFIVVNCGAIPESLIDSELFGHEKGAFTGALSQKRGRFERAQGGTIFLDEIGELPLGAQVRLLRVLQEKQIERIGGTETIPLDIRVIAATNRNLENMLAEGKFREDLYFRLNVFPILIPPLRERRADIPVLIQHFMMKKARQMGLAEIPLLAPGAMARLISYSWPGNVRELQNVVERALILSKGGPLTFEEPGISGEGAKPAAAPLTDISGIQDLDQAIARIITQALEKTNGRIEGEKGAAKLLNLNPSTLRGKMRRLGIPVGRKRNL